MPFAFDKVWNAARTVFERLQWGVRKADKAAGRYEVLVSIPTDHGLPIPFLEKFQVDITRIDENSTRVHSSIRFDQWHWGTTRWHVNTFLTELQRQLEAQG